MENKLQELTDKLYNEGLSKGKKEGEEILANARKEAADIVAAAQKEADEIRAKAEKEAADFKVKVTGDLKMAASQSIQATKKDIEDLVVFKMNAAAVESLFRRKLSLRKSSRQWPRSSILRMLRIWNLFFLNHSRHHLSRSSKEN